MYLNNLNYWIYRPLVFFINTVIEFRNYTFTCKIITHMRYISIFFLYIYSDNTFGVDGRSKSNINAVIELCNIVTIFSRYSAIFKSTLNHNKLSLSGTILKISNCLFFLLIILFTGSVINGN